MTQHELFDKATDIEYALSFHSSDLASLKASNYDAYQWVRDIRNAVHRYKSIMRHAENQLNQSLTYAKR